MVSEYTWTYDPMGKVESLDSRCCSKMCSLSAGKHSSVCENRFVGPETRGRKLQ